MLRTAPSLSSVRRRHGLAALLACALSGCGTTPPAHFYVVSPQAGAPAGDAGPGIKETLLVDVKDVQIPQLVDRPQFVTNISAYERRIDEFVRWAEPLGLNLTHVLSSNLASLLAPARVVHETNGLGVTADLHVAVAIQRFDVEPDGSCVLEARWTLHREGAAGKPLALRTETFTTGPGSTAPDVLVAGMSRNMLELSRSIAKAIGQHAAP